MQGVDGRSVVDRDAACAEMRLRRPGRKQRGEGEDDEGPSHLDRPADRLDHHYPGGSRGCEGYEGEQEADADGHPPALSRSVTTNGCWPGGVTSNWSPQCPTITSAGTDFENVPGVRSAKR